MPPPEVVKLTDFGIAKLVDAPALTFSELLFGTPGYIAPECVEGKTVDGRTDLYSLGVVLYEMVTAHLPYDARGADLLFAPLVSAPIPPDTRIAGLPPDLTTLVLTMLAAEPEDRPADAFAVQDALVELLRRKGGREQPGRTSIPALRDVAPTLIEPPPASAVGEGASPSRRTANVQKIQTSEIATRWLGALAELESSIDKAKNASLASGHPAPAHLRSGHSARIERASAFMWRRFELGTKVCKQARVATIAASVTSPVMMDVNGGDALLWEAAAMGAEADRAALLEEDLSHQILRCKADSRSRTRARDRACGGYESARRCLGSASAADERVRPNVGRCSGGGQRGSVHPGPAISRVR